MLWITGLSGSGKTTLAQNLIPRFAAENLRPILLDGDSIREVLGVNSENSNDFSRKKRLELALRYSKLSKVLSEQGFIVVVATISMFSEVYRWNRENLENYFELLLNVPIEELTRRDSKGIYSRFARGELRQVAGLDLHVDLPQEPDFILEPDLGGLNQTQEFDLFAKLLEFFVRG